MRKLAWFLIILAVLTPTIYALCLQYPDTVGATLHQIFLVTIPTAISSTLTGLMAWGAASGWQAAAVVLAVFVIGNIFWIGFRRLIWKRTPAVTKTVTQRIYQHAPTPTLPQVAVEPTPPPAPQPTPEPQPEQKQEAPAQ
ncbi:MAG: hypothetical protein DRJ03_04110 [Chloroflexi bacterium]|nr:MAG: hypothetical protein DRJ03_04110 [Chloroflexota bacterium]